MYKIRNAKSMYARIVIGENVIPIQVSLECDCQKLPKGQAVNSIESRTHTEQYNSSDSTDVLLEYKRFYGR